MLCLTYASVPLYSIFCKVTGYGGTTRRAVDVRKDSINKDKKKIRVYFNSDVAPDLLWSFNPEMSYTDATIGKEELTFYYAENLSDEEVSGMAVYNVTPFKAGKYFNKVACFCFNEQVLPPKKKVVMPISFFIDQDIILDPDTKDLSEITLSYTFFKFK